ncbi:divalent-cation tolerance protein CutA [Roseateles saccharophilus]|uniref:Periplasmic divalent cation tolerance protein n=1 Tax=Roseateles saccharophilus TaxID=304 RepID=A0A4R3VI87_ROSSA|nr:divalent-cation tolerance protein CutA [Roseateles saccharophilus]TCV03582.1 periplasmic divalent cation tolerance protein [Roseateles saccharophilus]
MDMLAVFTTVATEAQADALAGAAIEARLAACVQAEAIHSTYRWQGRIANQSEIRLLFKTRREHYAALERLLRERHPYELPAIFALEVAAASPGYAAWLQESLDGAPPQPQGGEPQA